MYSCIQEKESEFNATADMIDREVSDNSRKAKDQKRYTTLVKRYNAKKAEYDRLAGELEKAKSRYTSLNHMVDEIESLELIDSFDEGLCGTFVDYVTVNRGGTLVFTMKDGTEIKV